MYQINPQFSSRDKKVICVDGDDREELTGPLVKKAVLVAAAQLGCNQPGLGGFPQLYPIDASGEVLKVKDGTYALDGELVGWRAAYQIAEKP